MEQSKSKCHEPHVHGITCEVTNCVYNEMDSHACTAQSIKVGPQYAACCTDTACATFKAQA